MRIVSLLPAATEALCALGLEADLVGISHECDYPPSIGHLPRVTRNWLDAQASSGEIDSLVRQRAAQGLGWATLDEDLLIELAPDLVVTQSLCHVCAVSDQELHSCLTRMVRPVRVVSLSAMTLGEALDGLLVLGEATDVRQRALQVRDELQARVDATLRRYQNRGQPVRVAMLEWLDPPFTAGHWTPELVTLAGGIDVLGEVGQRSVATTWPQVVAANPQWIGVIACGLSLERAADEWQRLGCAAQLSSTAAVRDGQVVVFDGSAFFNRPGPRLVDSLELLAAALHGEAAEVAPRVAGDPTAMLRLGELMR